jgi:hypothetical protein
MKKKIYPRINLIFKTGRDNKNPMVGYESFSCFRVIRAFLIPLSISLYAPS